MKLLVSTQKGQGMRKNDFCWVPEGELVAFNGFECDGEKVDGSCGCKRAVNGIVSHTGTTTFMVAEVATTRQEILQTLTDFYVKDWKFETVKAIHMAQDDFAEMSRVASLVPIGTVLEKRGNKIKMRIIKDKP